jgi:microcystin-dependent protein
MDPYLGEIKLVPYTFAPVGWLPCQGQLLSIADNSALFSLLGTTYGGDGSSTFALPNLSGSVALSSGQSSKGSNYVLGQPGGSPGIALDPSQIPSHPHTVQVSQQPAQEASPTNNYPAFAGTDIGNVYGNTKSTVPSVKVNLTGGSQPHENRQPFLAMLYIIATEGIYPSQ